MVLPFTDARFLVSATDVSQLGACHAEVALVGRSNVGKSTLLNALTGRKALARVSRTPGRTRTINVFLTGGDRWIVDLPGYGYASGPARERERWRGLLEAYITSRDTLRAVCVLVDAEVGPTALDIQMIEWLQWIGRPYRVVATKTDRVKAGRQQARRREVASILNLATADLAWVSSEKGTAIPELRREIAALVDLA